MAMTMSADGKVHSAINMTPMIDVLLVLIIIFMVITPVPPRGLPAAIPQPPTAAAQEPNVSSDIVVTVRADGTMLLNRDPLTLDALRDKLGQIFKFGSSRPIFVRGESAIQFGPVAEVIDVARGAGIYHVGLMAN